MRLGEPRVRLGEPRVRLGELRVRLGEPRVRLGEPRVSAVFKVKPSLRSHRLVLKQELVRASFSL